MKKNSLYVMIVVMLSVFFVACDENEGDSKLTFDKKSVEVIVGDESVVKVSGGVAPYTATPSDKTVAEATVEGIEITVKGLKEGNTSVKVTDKNGLEATIPISVAKDPYTEEKEDATVRIKWDTFEKTEGEDAGTYVLTKDDEKNVAFSWENEGNSEYILLTFKDPEDKIDDDGGAAESASLKTQIPAPVGKLTIKEEGKDPVDYDVSLWRLVKAAPSNQEEGTPDTYWIGFTANGKIGIAVAPLTVAGE